MSRATGGHRQTLIRASAGTGKTFQLASRYLALVASGEGVHQILAATFARKAAGEIAERVFLRLADAVLDRQQLAELGEQLGRPDWSQREALKLLRTLAQQMHRLRIGTLDSFFMQVAGSFSLELNLPPGWTIAETVDDQALRAEAVRRLLASGTSSDIRALLHLLSKGAIKRQVTDQILDVVNQLYGTYCEADPQAWEPLPRPRLLSDDQWNQALAAFEALDGFPSGKWSSAHETACVDARRGDWEQFLSRGLADKLLGDGTFYRQPIPPAIAEVYGPLIQHAKAHVWLQFLHRAGATRDLLEKFHQQYQELQFRSGQLRFDDVTRALAAAAEQHALVGAHRLDGHVQHLLLDEFQDTSLPQWRVLRPLAQACTKNPRQQSFFCVGDVKQAIYGWRGGVAEIFETIDAELEQVETVPLARSYRSSPVVIDVVNRVFSTLQLNRALDNHAVVTAQWQQRFEKHTTALEHLLGYVCLQTAGRDGTPGERQAAVLECAAAETARLAQRWPHCTIGVLVRENESVARLIYTLRHAHGLTASEEGGNPLVDSAAVELVMSLLTMADHPGDTVARFHVAQSELGPLLGLTSHDDDQAAQRVASTVRRELLDQGYGTTLAGWVRGLTPHCDARDARRLQQLVELASQYEPGATLRPSSFVHYVRATRVEDPSSARIRVMTIHQAKGLEFDIVVLPALDRQLKGRSPQVVIGRPSPTAPIKSVCHYASDKLRRLLPPRLRHFFEAEVNARINEGLCNLYVAMTRAVHALHIIVSPHNLASGGLSTTPAGVLRAALCGLRRVDVNEQLFECGRRDWSPPAKPPAADAAPAAPLAGAMPAAGQPGQLALSFAGPRRRGWELVAPSALRSRSRIDLGVELRRDHGTAKTRGAVVHAWLEELDWLDTSALPRDRLLAIARQQGVGEASALRWADWLLDRLQRPALVACLSRASCLERGRQMWARTAAATQPDEALAEITLELQRERTFAMREGDVLLQGALDRLLIWRSRGTPFAAEVLDFKTDHVATPAESAQAIARHRPQIEAYCRAAARTWHLDISQVSGRIALLEPGEVHSLDDRF